MDFLKTGATILLTACGCPGAMTVINALKNNPDNVPIKIIGTDMAKFPGGMQAVDIFVQVPPSGYDTYQDAIISIVKDHKPDYLICQSSFEVEKIAKIAREIEHLGCHVLLSSQVVVATCNDKAKTYQALRGVIPIPSYKVCLSYEDIPDYAECIKPLKGKGKRGFAKISEVNDSNIAYPVIAMPMLYGQECAVDAFCYYGNPVLMFTKTREKFRDGLAMEFVSVSKPEIEAKARLIIQHLTLHGFVNIQFIGDDLLEINPRISTIINWENYNYPYLAIKYAAGENIGEAELRNGVRAVRYFDQYFIGE